MSQMSRLSRGGSAWVSAEHLNVSDVSAVSGGGGLPRPTRNDSMSQMSRLSRQGFL